MRRVTRRRAQLVVHAHCSWFSFVARANTQRPARVPSLHPPSRATSSWLVIVIFTEDDTICSPNARRHASTVSLWQVPTSCASSTTPTRTRPSPWTTSRSSQRSTRSRSCASQTLSIWSRESSSPHPALPSRAGSAFIFLRIIKWLVSERIRYYALKYLTIRIVRSMDKATISRYSGDAPTTLLPVCEARGFAPFRDTLDRSNSCFKFKF